MSNLYDAMDLWTIAGVVAAQLAVLALIGYLLWRYRRKKMRSRERGGTWADQE